MKYDEKSSDDVIEDRRGQASAGGGFPISLGRGGKLGIPGLIILVVAAFLGRGALGGGGGGGFDLNDALNQVAGQSQGSGGNTAAQVKDAQYKFVRSVANDLQDFWGKNLDGYTDAKLVLFDAPTNTGCGLGSPETGPFYCPADDKVYIDLGFYQQLSDRFGFQGDFAMAYVIAHEWGHHIQDLVGTNEQVDGASPAEQQGADGLSVKLELQADCLAGVWAQDVSSRGDLEKGDLREALTAAGAVGDDRIQQKTQGRVDPETFSHGTAEQRQQWFQTGYDAGDRKACNTFA